MTPENQKIADSIRNKIDEYCQNTYDDGHRSHLGASIIGHKCKRYLWFTFRWVYHHKHSGRMQRLFNTGHKEESRIIEWLRGAGFQVENVDPSTNEQFRIEGCEGHFGGSTDGIILIPDLGKCLLECKTNKTGPDFKAFFEGGMPVNKPKHWAQTCVYGKKLGLEYVVYICKNKDNDDLFIDIQKLDWNHGTEQEQKALEIITSQVMPVRLAETPAYFECKFCDYVDVCFRNKKAEKNCRSCQFASPGPNFTWNCNKFGMEIPKDFIKNGCDSWESII